VEDTAQAITLSGSDPRGRPLSYQTVRDPSRGKLTGEGARRIYTPNPNYHGADSFSFKVSNGEQCSNVATVYIAVSPVNDRPVLTAPGPQAVTAGQTVTFTITGQDDDAEQALTFEALNKPEGATFSQLTATSWQFSWTPTVTQVGTYAVSFRVTDDGVPPLSAVKTVVITVDSIWAKTSGPGGFTVNAVSQAGNALVAVTSRRNYYDSSNADKGSLLVSLDNGRIWSRVRAGLPDDQEFLSFTGDARTLFVGTGADGVYRSTDGGQTWAKANDGLPSRAKVVSLTVVQGKVIAGLAGSRIFRSDNEGESWVSIDAGVRSGATLQLAVLGSTLFAMVSSEFSPGGSIYRSQDAGRSWVEVGRNFQFRNLTALTAGGG